MITCIFIFLMSQFLWTDTYITWIRLFENQVYHHVDLIWIIIPVMQIESFQLSLIASRSMKSNLKLLLAITKTLFLLFYLLYVMEEKALSITCNWTYCIVFDEKNLSVKPLKRLPRKWKFDNVKISRKVSFTEYNMWAPFCLPIFWI